MPESINIISVVGLRDRVLIALMAYRKIRTLLPEPQNLKKSFSP